MSSSKNHTKNELARISAKIQQLKKKYPVSQQLYMSQQKSHHVMDNVNALQEIRLPVNNQTHLSNQRILRPKSISHAVKNNFSNQPNFTLPQTLQSFHKESLQNENLMNSSQNDSVKPSEEIPENHHHQLSSSAQSSSFQIDFMRQKPYKQYKEELKHLKKQILSGLDITNFPIKRTNEMKNPSIIANEPYNTFNKDTLKQIESYDKKVFNKENEDKFNQPTLQEIRQYKNRLIHNSKTKKDPMNHKTIQTSEYSQMKEQIKKLANELQQQKSQFQQRLVKLQFHCHSMNGQSQQIRNQLQFMQEKLLEALPSQKSQKKLSQYDLKIVEIQNQSINKLSKDIYKQLQAINSQLNNIKEIQFTSVKSNESNFGKSQIEEILTEYLQNNSTQLSQKSQQKIKQVESRFFREMFDIKNQIQLLNEKLKKQNYLQKTIKQLLPNKNRNKDDQIKEVIDKAKVEFLKDKGFLNNLFISLESSIDKKLPDMAIIEGKIQQVSQNLLKSTQNLIIQSSKKVKDEIGNFVYNELGFFSTSLKQFETKMASYSILIEHLQETIKQISANIVHHQTELKHNKQIQEQKMKTNQIISVQTENLQSRSLTSIQNHDMNLHKSHYAKSQLQQSSSSHIALPYCLIEEPKKQQQDQFFITKLGESKMSEIKNCQKGFLLEDLVKNSLVFSALNN